jgi:hypothetical protein
MSDEPIKVFFSYSHRDEAFTNVAEGIEKAVNRLQAQRKQDMPNIVSVDKDESSNELMEPNLEKTPILLLLSH